MIDRCRMLNTRGWLGVVLAIINLYLACWFAYQGSWWCIMSIFISFIFWLGIYDPKNLKQNEQSNK